MSENNRICKVCQTEYRYCPSCYEDSKLETWHIMFHDENCKMIWQICLDYFYQRTAKGETASLLKLCDLSHLDEFDVDMKNQIKEILDIVDIDVKPDVEQINYANEDLSVNPLKTYQSNDKSRFKKKK